MNSSKFGLLQNVTLDEQVDAQALVVSATTLGRLGITGYPNDLVYVSTENNTVYAIDSITGVIKFQNNLGTPVSWFGLLKTIKLDEQVDAQALVVSAATLADRGTSGYPNDFVYIATENNPVYAIHSVTGAVEFQTHLGTPVSKARLLGSCPSNSGSSALPRARHRFASRRDVRHRRYRRERRRGRRRQGDRGSQSRRALPRGNRLSDGDATSRRTFRRDGDRSIEA